MTTITLEQFELKVVRLLGQTSIESIDGGQDLVIDAVAAACDAILPWVPKVNTIDLIGDGSKIIFDLPVDLYEIQAVTDDSGKIIPHSILIPGHYIGGSAEDNDWLEYPDKQISFSMAPESGEVFTVYYLAYWTKPDSGTPASTVLEPPDFSITGMSFFAAAYCLLPQAISSAEVRQFGTKVDSGTPEQNPLLRSVDYFLKLFSNEMSRYPKYTRATK